MILYNGTIVTMDADLTIQENGAIRINNGIIEDIGDSKVICARYPGENREDVDGKLIMPGNICAHTHFYGAYARGLSTIGTPPGNFLEILEKLWWRIDKALTPESVKTSAQVCLLDAIRHGTTTLIDHHASPSCVDGSLDLIAEAASETGLRTCLCYEVTDRNGPQEAQAGINENMRFINRCRNEDNPLLAGTFGLHASLTLSDETLQNCCDAAAGTDCGFHIHAAEDKADQIDSQYKYGERVINRLKRFNMLGPKSLLAHCVHVDEKEITLIAESGSIVTHQPRSNMNNAVGCADVAKMLDKGITVAMGNDGFSNNMWAEWKTAYLVHKLVNSDPQACQGYDIMKMGITNNVKLVNRFWPEQTIGSLVVGSSADLVLVEYSPFTPMTSGNLPWHILFGMETDTIHSTMVRGKWLMRNREVIVIEEQEILQNAMEIGHDVWKRFNEGN